MYIISIQRQVMVISDLSNRQTISLISGTSVQLVSVSYLFLTDLPLDLAAEVSDIISQSYTVRGAPNAGQVASQGLEVMANTRQAFCPAISS